MTRYYWQPAGIFVTPPNAMQTCSWVSESGWVTSLSLPYWGRDKPADTNRCLLSSPLPKAINVLTQTKSTSLCLAWSAWVSQMLIVHYSTLEQGGQYPSGGKGFYSPWKDSTGADKSDISSLTFLTATTFEAFSFHPSPCCCCRGCHSALKNGDLPHKAAAAASAPCPCERFNAIRHWHRLIPPQSHV